MGKHKCPVCGEPTEGSYSEGGIHFSICEICYEKIYKGGREATEIARPKLKSISIRHLSK
ncbi:unnamed protein product [marine sediment metagenome]|uniref:Uncharacterized protein n=1 Tax=marine sediment metagenome TaxID=412755 RepID=X1S222_9ZZZZ